MKVGAHVDQLSEALAVGAEAVQIFLGDPQSWKKPPPRPDAEEIKASPIDVYVHAPYLINVASPNNKIRIPSRKILSDTCAMAPTVGAKGIIVHGGHAEDDPAEGVIRWAKALEQLETDVPILIENTAGGDNAMTRHLDQLARLWDAVGAMGVGFCFDTCHAHAAGEDVADAVERALAITGRIDLVHGNDSRDPAGSGRDRHTNLGKGEIGADALSHMLRTAGAPVICETPFEGIAADLSFVRDALASA